MMAFKLAYKQLMRQWSAGELRVLLAALIIAIAATTSVDFFTDRIQTSLQTQGNVLLGADAVITSDHPVNTHYVQEANARGLQTSRTIEFSSMAVNAERMQMAQIKAVEAHYPLRGNLTISAQRHGGGHLHQQGPEQGGVWIEPRLAEKLNLQVGDALSLGNAHFRVSAILQREASRGGEMFNIAPRLLMNTQDVASTGLIQFGSRVHFQLLVAGEQTIVQGFVDWAKPKLQRGEKIEDTSTARPEMKTALEKSQQFLGLSAMVSILLSMVAMFLASLLYVKNSLDQFALMRCLGASKTLITRILLIQTAMVALVGSGIGCLIGYGAQSVLAKIAGHLFLDTLPPATFKPVWMGLLAGFGATFSILWPHLIQMRNVPALRMLRRDLPLLHLRGWVYLPIAIFLLGIVCWHAGNLRLGLAALVGFVVLFMLVGFVGWLGSLSLQRLPVAESSLWRFGLAGLKRRPLMAVAQMVGLSLGFMAILLLILVRGDLMDSWKSSLPKDAPNRFVINIQQEQTKAIQDFFQQANIPNVTLYPMVKGRLIQVNHQVFDTSQFKEERIRHLAEREFNLSWSNTLQVDNRIEQGAWWSSRDAGKPYISLEQELAKNLHLKLGDVLTYDIAGSQVDLTITSLRKINWDSMHANFFALSPTGVLEQYGTTYMSSFYVPEGQDHVLNSLVSRFSNLTIIDVAVLMQQIRGLIDKMSYALEYVFAFSVLSGLSVLYAALVASKAERVQESTLLRVLGASKRQIVVSLLLEFVALAMVACGVGLLAANGLAFYVSSHLLEIPFTFNVAVNLKMFFAAILLIPLSAWLGTRRTFTQPPRLLLQSS